jgi:hypothetical protein
MKKEEKKTIYSSDFFLPLLRISESPLGRVKPVQNGKIKKDVSMISAVINEGRGWPPRGE